MIETAMTPRDRLRAHVMESVSKSGSGAVLVSAGEVAALFDEVDQLDFALDMLNGLYEDRTAYMIIHKGMGLACSSALREAYSDMSFRAEQAEATITQLRAELERVKGLVEARGSVWIDREAFDAVVAEELPYDTTLWPALQRKFGEGHHDQVRIVAIPREPTQAMLDAVGPGADSLKRRVWHAMYDAATARPDELRSVVDGAGGE